MLSAQTTPPASAPPRRILHVLPALDHGGIETTLLQLLRIVDRSRYCMDFLVVSDRPGAQANEARALGSRVVTCPHRGRPWRFAGAFVRALATHGPYDVVHSHVHLFSGFVLKLAHRHGVPVRIAHSRYDTRMVEHGAGRPRRGYARLMRHWIRAHANCRLAISRSSAEDLFGSGWQRAGVQLILSGRDFEGYRTPARAAVVRAELGLPADAFVVGNVGRFFWSKNHPFLIEVAAELVRRAPEAWLVLVGDGPDRAHIEALARARRVRERTIFAGARRDVPRLVTGAMDAFVFPSHHEGLGLAAVEAQAAGLPCFLADMLPAEIDVVDGLVHRLPLTAPPALWAARIVAARATPRPSPEAAFQRVRASPFSIERMTAQLLQIYDRVDDPTL